MVKGKMTRGVAVLVILAITLPTFTLSYEPPLSHAGIMEVATRCCKIGQQWFIQSRESCNTYPTPIGGVNPDEEAACVASIQACCLQEKQNKRCTVGKQNARIRRSCTGLNSQIGNEDARECCHCCHLGMMARESGLQCDEVRLFENRCNQVVEECCLSTSGVTTTPFPTLQTTPLGICARFSNQLCAHMCIDLPGSYRCSCHDGFILHSDGRTCKQKNTGDRCAINNPCAQECVDSGVAIHCQCFDGYLLKPDGRNCQDINECTVGTHKCSAEQRCVNREGSYACEGPSGTLQGTSASTRCLAGFVFNTVINRCEDINECRLRRDNCGVGKRCVNTEGGFLCQTYGTQNTTVSCSTGFIYSRVTARCEDINECALSRDSCLAGQQCENTPGSYVCRRAISCGTGYTLDKDSQRCQDDDECSLGTHNCGPARECVNIEGSFRCETKTCPVGYRLDYSSGTCAAIICNKGMRAVAGGSCIDINECVENPSTCRPNQRCINTIGSRMCRNLVNCGPGFEISTTGSNCVDIDECARDSHDCKGAHQTCVNRPGTYMCQCPNGYSMNHRLRRCDDINECARFAGQVCSQNSVCENTEGSFRCTCKEGFEQDAAKRFCKDKDECQTPNLCHHQCRNTWGSYQCVCRDGYQIAPNKRTCEDIDECSLWSDRGGSLCIGLCQNTVGSYTCSCPEGYSMLGDGRTCQDIDECGLRIANCNGPEDFCINTRGGFKCERVECPAGFVKAATANNRNNRHRQSDDPYTRRRHRGERHRRIRRIKSRKGVSSIQPSPPKVVQTNETGVVCQKAVCGPTDIDCLLDTVKSIQYQFISLPTVYDIPRPAVLLKEQSVGVSIFPNVWFTILEGNDEEYFDVVNTPGHADRGSLRLLRPVSGPEIFHLKLQMDNQNNVGYTISSHIAHINIYVSAFDF